MLLPAYLVSSGLGSNVSMCETPPFMNSQMTLLALGGAVRLAVGRRESRRRRGEAIALQHGAERQAGEAHAEVGKEGPPVHAASGFANANIVLSFASLIRKRLLHGFIPKVLHSKARGKRSATPGKRLSAP